MELKIMQLLLFLCMKVLVSAEIRCIESERQALLKFSSNLSGLTWGSEEHKWECCNWEGVECTDTGHVFSLDLSDMDLRGKISPALRELLHLEYLILIYNDLTIDNLNWISDISSLTHLDLSGVNISVVTNWLEPIAKLSSLVELSLSGCQLRGPLSAFDVSANSSLSSLSDLDLSDNELTSFLIFDSMFNFSRTLTLLDLSGNQLKRLPKFEQLVNLKFLFLPSNSVEGTITEHHLANLTQLKELDLSFNNLSFTVRFDWIPTFQLEIIRLSHCNMGPYFPNWIQYQNSLSELSLSFAGISSTLPNWLWNMSSIQHLDLSHNNISGGMLDLTMNFYKILDLSYNNLSGPIPLSVFRYSRMLRLSKNLLSGSIFNLCTISEQLPVEVLILSDNQLDGELPDCWMNIPDLNVLDLANNKLSGKIPPTLSTPSRLLILRLGNNNFTGELGSWLKNCTMLRKLDVGGNKLTGTIPAWIGTHLTNLKALNLRFNSFHGSIPPTICYLTVVHVLDLSRNNISGKIPRCLNNFTSLTQNDGSTILGSNFWLNGQPSEEDDNDNTLVQWKGQESEYRRLKSMKGIDLSSNKLVGTIPQALSDLKGLVFINLSRNHLTGNIISSVGQLETLEWLDLSRNQLSGDIPNSLANLHFLSVLDLSYNNLIGKIPLSTQLQSFDSSAYVGNSQLCGNPLVECPHDPWVNDHGKVNVVKEDDRFINRDFYICMAFGFITGFWIVVGTLVLKHSWRHSYFKLLNNIGDWMYMTTTTYVTRFKRKFMS
ncbi:receptor 12 [Olea europaea subsp. europaea]|uniref:Receptor 12 n=1 Tax=Olea europaea subsp. europaea TaxID=158383 RepID=A0A8S0UA66_OLEEU|nr:receptor 12 [Olea europaea subsp. europaea]